MKIIKVLLALVLLTVIILPFCPGVSAADSKTVTKVDTYEMFWPIVPGKVMGERLYFLKMLKEKVRGALIFSAYKKADYLITISEKRLVEAEALYKKEDWANAKGTLDNLVATWQKVKQNIDAARASGQKVATLETRFAESLGKQNLVLEALVPGLSADQQKYLESALNAIKSVLP